MILASNGSKVLVFECKTADISSEDLSKGGIVSFKGWVFEIISFASPDGKGSTIVSHPAQVANSGKDGPDPYNVSIRKEDMIWFRDVPAESSLYKQIRSTYISPEPEPEPEAKPEPSPSTDDKINTIREMLLSLTPEELKMLNKK